MNCRNVDLEEALRSGETDSPARIHLSECESCRKEAARLGRLSNLLAAGDPADRLDPLAERRLKEGLLRRCAAAETGDGRSRSLLRKSDDGAGAPPPFVLGRSRLPALARSGFAALGAALLLGGAVGYWATMGPKDFPGDSEDGTGNVSPNAPTAGPDSGYEMSSRDVVRTLWTARNAPIEVHGPIRVTLTRVEVVRRTPRMPTAQEAARAKKEFDSRSAEVVALGTRIVRLNQEMIALQREENQATADRTALQERIRSLQSQTALLKRQMDRAAQQARSRGPVSPPTTAEIRAAEERLKRQAKPASRDFLSVEGVVAPSGAGRVWVGEPIVLRGGAVAASLAPNGASVGLLPPQGRRFAALYEAAGSERNGKPIRLSVAVPLSADLSTRRLVFDPNRPENSIEGNVETQDGRLGWKIGLSATPPAGIAAKQAESKGILTLRALKVEEETRAPLYPHPDGTLGPDRVMRYPVLNVDRPWRLVSIERETNPRPGWQTVAYVIGLPGKATGEKRAALDGPLPAAAIRFLPSLETLQSLKTTIVRLPPILMKRP
jgi:hypothetical protein